MIARLFSPSSRRALTVAFALSSFSASLSFGQGPVQPAVPEHVVAANRLRQSALRP